MNQLIAKYRSLPYEEKMLYTTRASLGMNLLLGTGKILFGLFFGFVFIIAGSFNIFMFLAKLECLLGIKTNKRTFEKRNTLISIFLFIASVIYIFYMGRMILFDVKTYNYTMLLGIMIALVAFIELGVAIYGLFRVKKSGHYYRNIKIINFCSALTAIVLTQVAILSFTGTEGVNQLNGLSGVIAGVCALLLSIYIYFAPRVSIIDREYNVYKIAQKEKNNIIDFNVNKGDICLKESKIYGNYIYLYSLKEDLVEGHVMKTKGFWSGLNIYIKILLIVLSEILIFVYAIGRLVYFFRTLRLIEELDEIMIKNGFEKVNE